MGSVCPAFCRACAAYARRFSGASRALAKFTLHTGQFPRARRRPHALGLPKPVCGSTNRRSRPQPCTAIFFRNPSRESLSLSAMAVRRLRIERRQGQSGLTRPRTPAAPPVCRTSPRHRKLLPAPPRGPLAGSGRALVPSSIRRSWPLGKTLKKKRRHERHFGSAEIIEFQNSKFEAERTFLRSRPSTRPRPTISRPCANLPR